METLGVAGGKITTGQGEPVQLRGTCIGGWMNMEGFINGFPGLESDLRLTMAQALGAGKAQFFFDRWLDHFLAEEDIAFIQSCGANVVRLALNYSHFESDAEPSKYIEKGFERLDRAVRWCDQHSVYVILDLHAAQGGQNPDWHSDNQAQRALLWKHPHFQDRFVALWQEIARRYASNPAVAGYDLMNEPLTNAASEIHTGVYQPDWDAINSLYRRAVKAIRQVDPRHIIFLEGDGFASRFAGFDEPFADHLVYSSHNYSRAGWGPGPYPGLHKEGYWDIHKLAEILEAHEGTRFARQHGTPLWAGEFGSVFNGPTVDRADRLRGMDDQLAVFEAAGVHWTSWTYKDIGVMGWVNVHPESEYLRMFGPLQQTRRQFHTDSWMYWLPVTPPKALMGELAGMIHQALDGPSLDSRQIQDRLIRTALGGVAARLFQANFANCFKGMSENEIDQVLASFALRNCTPNQELVDIVSKYMKRPDLPIKEVTVWGS